jgi:hypothetical protein
MKTSDLLSTRINLAATIGQSNSKMSSSLKKLPLKTKSFEPKLTAAR